MPKCSRPCPGCGERDKRRKAAEVCWDCRQKLDTWKRQFEIDKKMQTNDQKMYAVPEIFWPYIPHQGNYSFDDGALERIKSSLVKIAKALGVADARDKGGAYDQLLEKAEHLIEARGDLDRRMSRRPLWMRPEHVEVIRKLDGAIREALACEFTAGKEEGSSLLRGLITGETTIQEFNKETIKANGQKRTPRRHN